jgi:copper(I)-binding protein
MTRTLSLSAASLVLALGLAVAPAVAQTDETPSDPPASPGPAAASTTPHMASMAPGLTVSGAWARQSPMVALAGAAYLLVRNGSDTDDAIVAAHSPVAEAVELHLSSMDDEGMMSMNQVAEIPVPAHGEVRLEPGSYHIMLIGLTEPLLADDSFELTLEFRSAEPRTLTVPVLASSPMDMEHPSMDPDPSIAADGMAGDGGANHG